ncbi:MlaD family protein [Nannocystis radixulma]|uniref:MlaD family protein n=1 Tax=Nannocystis radixulma TaxID=2995305 RepID=A0ABT5BNW4_9BACT|nr:MlaD family protein [Nannocystis radixulma]MDC0675859.1 MlaD family protein [Nannocystis radixulma]
MNTRYLSLAIFVTVTMAALAGLAWTLGALPKSGTHYRLHLDDAGGLVEGNAVRIAGVQIGQIKKIGIDGNQALLELRIDPEVQLFAETCASPQMKGLLGEKFLHLRQPTGGTPLPPGSDIPCVDPSVDIGEALNAMNGVVEGDEALYGHVVRIVKRMDTLTKALDEGGLPSERLDRMLGEVETMLTSTKEMLAENREDLRAIVKATRAHLENPSIPRMISRGDSILTVLDQKLPGLLDSGKKVLGDGEEALAKLEKLVDSVDTGKVESLLADGGVAVKNLRKISEEFQGVGKSIMPMLKDLGTIAHRGAAINEKLIRDFFQIEGFRVRLAVPYGVRGKVEKLEE